jgi:hypothetical protein
MHADSLFHRMLAQEKAIEDAEAEGRPTPSFPPLLSSKETTVPTSEAPKAAETNQVQISDLSPKVQEMLKKRLDGLSESQRQLEERAIKAEIQAGEQVAGHLTTIFEKQAAERKKRKEEGRETIADKFTTMFRGQ